MTRTSPTSRAAQFAAVALFAVAFLEAELRALR